MAGRPRRPADIRGQMENAAHDRRPETDFLVFMTIVLAALIARSDLLTFSLERSLQAAFSGWQGPVSARPQRDEPGSSAQVPADMAAP